MGSLPPKLSPKIFEVVSCQCIAQGETSKILGLNLGGKLPMPRARTQVFNWVRENDCGVVNKDDDYKKIITM